MRNTVSAEPEPQGRVRGRDGKKEPREKPDDSLVVVSTEPTDRVVTIRFRVMAEVDKSIDISKLTRPSKRNADLCSDLESLVHFVKEVQNVVTAKKLDSTNLALYLASILKDNQTIPATAIEYLRAGELTDGVDALLKKYQRSTIAALRTTALHPVFETSLERDDVTTFLKRYESFIEILGVPKHAAAEAIFHAIYEGSTTAWKNIWTTAKFNQSRDFRPTFNWLFETICRGEESQLPALCPKRKGKDKSFSWADKKEPSDNSNFKSKKSKCKICGRKNHST